MPLVIRAAFALSPKFRPSIIPAPIAIIFFKAPAIDAPCGSLLGYSLKFELWNNLHIDFEILISTVSQTSLDFLNPMFKGQDFRAYNLLIVNQKNFCIKLSGKKMGL